MSEPFPETTRAKELAPKAAAFFGAWAANHAKTIPYFGVLPSDTAKYPWQDPSVSKTLSIINSGEAEPDEGYVDRVYSLIELYCEDPDKAKKFTGAYQQPHRYEGGRGRSHIEVLKEDYLSQGKNVIVLMGHADEGLSDSPRFVAGLEVNLGHSYGPEYLGQSGLVAAETLKHESWHDIPIVTVLSFANIYWTAAKSDNVQQYLEAAGISQEDLDEIYDLIITGGSKALLRDLKFVEGQIGKAISLNATAKRAVPEYRQNGEEKELASITFGDVGPGSATLTTAGQAMWPVAVVNGEIEFGPIIPIEKPRGVSKDIRNAWAMQAAEDGMDILMGLVNQTMGKDVARYHRKSPPGDIIRSAELPEVAA